MKIEMQKQTNQIMQRMDEKLNPLIKEISDLKLENKNLHEKIDIWERKNRMNNIIAFGIKEQEHSKYNLMEKVIELIRSKTDLSICVNDINTAYRLGIKNPESGRPRPVLISFLNLWMKEQVMKNRKKMNEIFLSEDYPKTVLIKRKALQEQLNEERKKGNYAVIKYDKLVVRESSNIQEKRKRERSTSSTPPQRYIQKSKLDTNKITNTNRSNVFDVTRVRSNSPTVVASTSKKV